MAVTAHCAAANERMLGGGGVDGGEQHGLGANVSPLMAVLVVMATAGTTKHMTYSVPGLQPKKSWDWLSMILDVWCVVVQQRLIDRAVAVAACTCQPCQAAPCR